MTVAKMQFRLGSIEFQGEGEQKWLSTELSTLIKALPDLVALAGQLPSQTESEASAKSKTVKRAVPSLAKHIANAGAGSNQVARFLATAVWLHDKGSKRIASADVRKALSDNNQNRLSNPADCLNKLVAKGHCEKEGNKFFVTDEGRTASGTK